VVAIEFGLQQCPRFGGRPAAVPIEIDSDSDSSRTNFDPMSPDDDTNELAQKIPGMSALSPKAHKDKAYEVFCGSGRLTLALAKSGFNAIGIDYKGNRDAPKGRCIWLDLAKPSGQRECTRLLEADDVAYVHFAPPNGTSSKARERRRCNTDGTPAMLDPRPLRSESFPDGLPTLSDEDRARVRIANDLYESTARMAAFLSEKGVSWTIESPKGSYMWDTLPFRKLARLKANGHLGYARVTFDMCMHGGDRPKATTFLVSKGLDFSALALSCDGSHEHKPWSLVHEKGSIFATAAERNYPHLLCRRVATIVAKRFDIAPLKQPDQMEKAAANLQPKKRFPPIVPEYARVTKVSGVSAAALDSFRKRVDSKPSTPWSWLGLLVTPGSKVLNVDECGVSGLSTVTVGLGWTTEEFLGAARSAVHPFDQPATVPPEIAEALWKSARDGPIGTIARRRAAILKYTKLKHALQIREESLHKNLHPDVEKVVADKSILLFKQMLEDIGYDDIDVHSLLITGVKLIGQIPPLAFWQPDPEKLPRITPEMLWSEARTAQSNVSCLGKSLDPGRDGDLWNITLEEVEGGGLAGPFSAAEITAKFGPLWVPSRRFGVVQNDKLRPIDDFSEPGVNAAYGSGMKVNMKGLDSVVNIAKARIESVRDGSFALQDTSGEWWCCNLHKDWTQDQWVDLAGRVADLKSAYKQLATHPAHAAAAVIALRSPQGDTKFFRAYSLMFGTTAAVYAFLRFSRAISVLAARLLSVTVVEFFDDFTQVEPERLCESAYASLEQLLNLLGWRISMSEEKRKSFSKLFVSLGVEVDLSLTKDKKVLLRNKPGRVEGIRQLANSILAPDGRLGFKEALSLRGRVSYAEGQTHARVTAPLARLLSNWASIRFARPPSDELRFALPLAIKHLEGAGPRTVQPISDALPVLIFSDGACEETTSVGAVLIDPLGANEYFGATVGGATVDSWKTKLHQSQVIGQAELFPLWVARLTWADRIRGRRVIFFVDNESARIAAVKSYSPVLASLDIIVNCVGLDYTLGIASWYARVPTCCNVADGPSRLNPEEAIRLTGARCVRPIFPSGTSPTNVLM
jgi:hypothetical protein